MWSVFSQQTLVLLTSKRKKRPISSRLGMEMVAVHCGFCIGPKTTWTGTSQAGSQLCPVRAGSVGHNIHFLFRGFLCLPSLVQWGDPSLSINPSYPSIQLSIYSSICLSMHVHPFNYLSSHLSIHLPVHQSVHPSTRLCPSISVYLSTHLADRKGRAVGGCRNACPVFRHQAALRGLPPA